jgi:CHAD domain-containing protein
MASPSLSEVSVRKPLVVLRRALPQAVRGDVESLHQARVATRRLREVLFALGAPGTSQPSLQRKVRRLTRALGTVRELDVGLENLEELQSDPRVPRSAVALLRRVLLAERRTKQKEFRKIIATCDLQKLGKRALRIARRVPATSDGAGTHLDGAWRHASQRAHLLQVAIEYAGGIYRPGRLHDVRIAGKKLRYALEATTTIGGIRPLAGVKRLEQAQELLGRMHDFQVLIARALDLRSSPGEATPGRAADLNRFARRLEGKCRELHTRYVGMRPSLLAVCERVERAARCRREAA